MMPWCESITMSFGLLLLRGDLPECLTSYFIVSVCPWHESRNCPGLMAGLIWAIVFALLCKWGHDMKLLSAWDHHMKLNNIQHCVSMVNCAWWPYKDNKSTISCINWEQMLLCHPWCYHGQTLLHFVTVSTNNIWTKPFESKLLT